MKVCLDLHDFSVVNNRLDLLLKLKQRYPGFKASLFTVPVDGKEDWGPYLIRKQLLEEVKKHLDWIQIIPHGLMHDGSEMKSCGYNTFKKFIIPEIEKAFEKDGLPYIKGFVSPHWRWNNEIVRVLNEMGWWGAIDPRQPDMACPSVFYRYSHCIDEILPDVEVLKLHGHVYGTRNDLGKCFENICKLPASAEWHFVTDFLEE